MAHNFWKWHKMDKSDQNSWKWSNMAGNGPTWLEMDQNGQK